MELEGVVHNGVIVPDDGHTLAEGTRVRIVPASVADKSETGLCLEGNVLVHRGVSTASNGEPFETLRDERFKQLTEGLPQ